MQKKSLNRVILIGHLGTKPEGRYTQQGQATATFTLATNESWNNKEGSSTDHVEWHRLIAWGKLAEFSMEYLYKGQLISIEGSLRTRKWEDKEGRIHKTTEILCSSIVPLEWKKQQTKTHN